MKKIITIMVLGFMFATVAMADGPKYGFMSRPASSYQSATYGSGSVRNRRTLISNKVSIDRSAAAGGGYSRSASSLGLSSSASAGTSYQAGSSSFGGGSSSSVAYGRTSGRSLTTSSFSSGSTSYYKTSASGLGSFNSEDNMDGNPNPTMADVLSSVNTPDIVSKDGDTAPPVGDAIIPLLLLISLVTVYKWRKMR